jgi:hypothetical protein
MYSTVELSWIEIIMMGNYFFRSNKFCLAGHLVQFPFRDWDSWDEMMVSRVQYWVPRTFR